MLTWTDNFITTSIFFIFPLIVILLGKLVYRIFGRKIEYEIPKNSTKFGYILLMIAIVLCVLSTSPVSGQGYDTPIFVFRSDYIHENGLLTIFQTDRPLTYLLTDIIMSISNTPGRVTIPISSVVFTAFYIFSIFVLSTCLTKNTLLSGIASLFASGSNIVWLSALCFVGNMLGFALLYLLFSVIVKFLESKKVLYFIASMILFVCLFFSHFITALFAIIIVVSVLVYLRINKTHIEKQFNLGISLFLFSVLFALFLSAFSENFAILTFLFETGVTTNMNKTFLQYVIFDWTSDFLWIFLFSILGSMVILFEKEFPKKFLSAWIIGVSLLMVTSLGYAGRMLLYLPFSILASMGVYFVITRHLKKYKKVVLIIVSIFLISVPVTYYLKMRHMNIKYFEEGPFSWDTKYLETEQLKWIKNNYDKDSIVVLSDILGPTSTVDMDNVSLSSRGLSAGVDTRILAEVGNTVYFGHLKNLLLENPDVRGNNTIILGKYSSLNVDWTLVNREILIPETIYKITENEKSICYEITDGIYSVKMEDVPNWLMTHG